MTPRHLWFACAGLALLAPVAAHAHSASNAYLTLTTAPGDKLLHGQWDVALRDLDFALHLDDDGDGNILWGELRRHQQAIADSVYPRLELRGDGRRCRIKPQRQLVDEHADGSYAALFFDLDCGGRTPRTLTLDYSLFFGIDPSHRGIFVLKAGDQTSTALLAPGAAHLELKLAPADAGRPR